jgi:lysophospholipase L1-like esterase
VSPSRASAWHAIAIAGLGVVLAAAVAEIALLLLAPVPNPYEELERLKPQINQYIRFEYPRHYSAITEAEPGLPGLSGRNRFTTNNFGLRGDSLRDPCPPEEFRIFMVGGSTTECFYLDDEDDMARVVQRELSAVAPAGTVVRVYNAGLSGAASDDHVATISQRLVHLEPDLIVVLCGINDLSRSIYHYDYRHFIDYRPAYRKPWYKRSLVKLQITRRLLILQQRVRPTAKRLQESRTLVTNYAGLVGLQRGAPESDAPPRVDERSYGTNLRTMVGIARVNGFGLVLMTQQTTWNSDVDPRAKEYHWMRYRAEAPAGDSSSKAGVRFREDRMDAAMERLNGEMRRVCGEHGVPLYDLARILPKSLDYFYDDCHFNTAGAEAAGKGLAAFLVAQRLVPVAPPDGRIGATTEMPRE